MYISLWERDFYAILSKTGIDGKVSFTNDIILYSSIWDPKQQHEVQGGSPNSRNHALGFGSIITRLLSNATWTKISAAF